MIYEFASCRLDTAAQELARDGTAVHVEPQVLAILEHLIAHRDRVVSKIELLDEIWGDRFVSESALTSRIKWARKACGDTGRDQKVIRTFHGRGYRFIAEMRDPAAPSSTMELRARPGVIASRGGGVLVGRDGELARLEECVREVSRGDFSAAFVSGEAGAGKSALVSELLERVDPQDWWVLRGRCLRARSGVEPYFVLLDAWATLAATEADLVASVLERVAPTWLSQLPSLADGPTLERLAPRLLGFSAQRMVREGVDALSELARTRPVVLALEALEWVDDSTLDVLELLMQRAASPVLLVGTVRTGSTAHTMVTNAAAEGRALEIDLPRLGPEAVADIVRSALGVTEVPAELLRVVEERSNGNPLFTSELIAVWQHQGLVDTAGGVVRLAVTADELRAQVPRSLPPLVEQALMTLGPSDVQLLEAASVAGASASAAEIAAALGRPSARIERPLADLSRVTGLLEAQGREAWPDGTLTTRYAFTHPLFRDVILGRMAAGPRAEAHGRVGRALEQAYGDRAPEIAALLADHFIEASEVAAGVEYLRLAGEQAVARGAYATAVALTDEALVRLGAVEPPTARDVAELRVRVTRGPALAATRGWFDPEVRDSYERALELCESVGPCPEEVAARYGLAIVSELSGQFAFTEQLMTPLVESEGAASPVVEARELLACSAFHQGAYDRSVVNADVVLAPEMEGLSSVLMARIAEHPASSCSSWRSLSRWAMGHLDESTTAADEAVALGELNPYALSTALQRRAMLHQLRREPEECLRWAERTRTVGTEQRFAMRLIQADIYKGWALGMLGQVQEGKQLLTDGLARFRASGATLNEPYYLALLAEVLLQDDQPGRALERLDESLAALETTTRTYFYAPEIHRLRARALLAGDADGRVEAARAELDEALAMAQASGSPVLALRAVTDRVVLERGHGDPGIWHKEGIELLQALAGEGPTPDLTEARALLTNS